MNHPLVSVVTPFYNSAPYLAQCIESVLGQTLTNFEYILVDNSSTDGSREIAEEYARRDSRIRLLRRPQTLSQVRNYNLALGEISRNSVYCKMVQADDYIFPDCLILMVQAFGQSQDIGLVSSYWLKGNELRGTGFPHPAQSLPGKEIARLYLRAGLWVFGSPSAVMYRASLVRAGQPFYDESRLHEDTEKCMEILEQWNFGFVHQVLSFSRADNESISSAARIFDPNRIDRYILVQRYASAFLDAPEASEIKAKSKDEYYGFLAQQAFRLRDSAFWRYHMHGLHTLGETLDWQLFAAHIGRAGWQIAASPGATAARAFRSINPRKGNGKATPSSFPVQS